VVCPNDIITIGAMKKFMEMGKRLPHDISIIGYGDIPISEYTSPGLTALKYPAEEIYTVASDITAKKNRRTSYCR
jgi:LacI family transcriptional regulator